MRHARSIWCMTSSYSKTSGFVRPNVNEKPAFSKISTLDLRAFLKRCVLGDRFYQIRVDGRPDWGIKYPFSSSDRCGRAKTYFFFLFFLCSRCLCHASVFILKETDTTPYGFLTKSNYQPTLYLLVALVHTLLLQGSRLLVFPESELYTSNPWGNQTEHSSLRNSKRQYSFLASVVHTGLFYDTSILHENNC